MQPRMQRASSSTERTPLVAPTYVYETSLSRSYQKRLHNFQCAVCVALIALLGISLLVTVSYNLAGSLWDNSTDDDVSTTSLPPIAIPPVDTLQQWPVQQAPGLKWSGQQASSPKLPIQWPIQQTPRLTAISPDFQPFMNNQWPLKDRPVSTWGDETLTPKDLARAIMKSKAAIKELRRVEALRRPLDQNTPAMRAQWAAATSENVKPLADAAYGVEEATRMLLNGTDITADSSIGIGPPTNGIFAEPPYCSPTPPPCTPSKYRSLDGTCNNLEHPLLWGVSNTPFRRVLPARYGDGISSPRTGIDGAPLPSARDVSVTVHRPSYAHDSMFTVMLAVWGQFVDHDMTATALSKGQNSSALLCCDPLQPPHPECFPVQLDVEDPFYQDYNITCMEFVRSAPAPTCHFGPREQMNQASAFIDGSTVYGTNEKRVSRLLDMGGQLKMLKIGSRTLLPPSTDPNDGCNTAEMNALGRYCFESGDDRANENLHLTTMHLIWARQHNRIATNLRRFNPLWDDETVYQESRKVLGAQMQHITYAEFLPAILGTDVMWALNLTLHSTGTVTSYDPTVDPSIANHFSAAVFRFAHTLLPGLMHSADVNNGTINYMQLHQMLFNPYSLYTAKGTKDSIRSAMQTVVHSADLHVTTELSNRMFENPMTSSAANASDPGKPAPAGPCGLDLVSLNIQRGRDHGLPPYPEWREHCGMNRPSNFTDLAKIFDASSLERIQTIYKNVDDIDLYTGALAEDPKGRLLGPTLTCLIADQFLRLKVGDRFWYETSDATVGFTVEQLTEIRKTTLAGVICANEALLDQAQPRVMEAVSATNPLVDCKELPQPDFTPWTDPAAAIPKPFKPAVRPGVKPTPPKPGKFKKT